MAGRATYTEQDKARVYVVLTANDGNVKRTSRETGVPENTVRRWRNEFQKEPPAAEIVQEAVGDFVEDAERVSNKALKEIERKIDAREAKVSELNVTVGVLRDKIDRAKGLDTQRVDVKHHLPSPDEARALVGAFADSLRELSKANTAEIVDAEIVEQPALPSGQ